MAQEALNNIAQHADAQKVLIELISTPQYVQLAVEDDGRGFDPGNVREDRYGLIGLNERAHYWAVHSPLKARPTAVRDWKSTSHWSARHEQTHSHVVADDHPVVARWPDCHATDPIRF